MAKNGVRAAGVKRVAVPGGSSTKTAGCATPNAVQKASRGGVPADAGGAGRPSPASARSCGPQTAGPRAAVSACAVRSLHWNAETRGGDVLRGRHASHSGTVASSAAQSRLPLLCTSAGTRAAASTFASVWGAVNVASVNRSGARAGALAGSGVVAIVQWEVC